MFAEKLKRKTERAICIRLSEWATAFTRERMIGLRVFVDRDERIG